MTTRTFINTLGRVLLQEIPGVIVEYTLKLAGLHEQDLDLAGIARSALGDQERTSSPNRRPGR